MEQSKKEFFIKAGLINLTLVALIGALMRYKIGFEFPFFNQKNLLHAHSHYALRLILYVQLVCLFRLLSKGMDQFP